MPNFSLNLADVSESIKIDPGKYAAMVGKVELVESSDKTSHNLRWGFQLTGHKYEGVKLTMFTSLKPTALWRLKGVLRNLGFVVDGTINFEVDEDTGILVDPPVSGLPCLLVIKDDTYNGQIRSVVDDVLPMSDGDLETVSAPAKSAAAVSRTASTPLKLR